MTGGIRRLCARGLVAVAVAFGALGLALIASATGQSISAAGRGTAPGTTRVDPTAVARGRTLFVQSCSACHGFNARGIPGMGPSLIGVGAQAADFYLSTGRMPLNNPRDPPVRTRPAFKPRQINDLIAYVGSFGGPPIPAVDAARGNIAHGFQTFALSCSGCHQISAAGGIVTGGIAPPLNQTTPVQVGEAVRIGPFLMPRFTTHALSAYDVDSVARYVLHTRHPTDIGGWGIGHIGPVPEGMVAWFIALVAMVGVARLIGEGGDA
jgi:ubiquinol-cytochrome c reductase cytochrome c subunit